MYWENNFFKNPIKNKIVKIKDKMPPPVKKTTSEKAHFCANTIFSLQKYSEKFHVPKPLAFSLHFLFRRHQNQHFKIMKMSEQILKKTVGRNPAMTQRRLRQKANCRITSFSWQGASKKRKD